MTSILAGFSIAFGLSLAATSVCERVGRRVGMVAPLRNDRWHRAPVPLLGGVAIALGALLPLTGVPGGSPRLALLTLTALAVMVVGLVDDAWSLSPQLKLICQILLASILMHFGLLLRLTAAPVVNVLLTVFWIVGVTNAFNLLDNMDGLASSIALVAGGFRTLFFVWSGDLAGAAAAACLTGAVAGFLVRNFPPAKIFMGDAGSLFIGFYLAGLSLTGEQTAYSRGVTAVLLLPVLLLLIPIFDTAFVTVTRLLSGRSIAVGGRDHTSHRLVAVGLSERQVLLVLVAVAAASGAIAVLSYRVGSSYTVALMALMLLGLALLGVYLGRVHVVVEAGPARETGAILRLLADFQYKRQVFSVALDLCLIVIAYYGAHVLRFEAEFPRYAQALFRSLPAVMLIQLAALAGFGLYRGIWQYTGLNELLRMVRATAAGVMTSVVVLVYFYRFEGFSRTVFVLDWLLLLLLIGGSRISFRLFGELFRATPDSFRRVLIYGAGDGGELIVRELLNNPALQRVPIGFIDDDRGKHHTSIHGLPVLGGSDQVAAVLRERGVSEVIVSSAKVQGGGLDWVSEVCESLQVPLRRVSLRFE